MGRDLYNSFQREEADSYYRSRLRWKWLCQVVYVRGVLFRRSRGHTMKLAGRQGPYPI